MTRTSNIFTNPAGTAVAGAPDPAHSGWTSDRVAYHWLMNHAPDGEEEHGGERAIESTATTSGDTLVRQQGAEVGQTLLRRGVVLDPDQHDAFVLWFKLCKTQSIYFTDFAGDSYEVVITSFKSRKIGVVKNLRGDTRAPRHKWEYTMTMDVIRVLDGSWS